MRRWKEKFKSEMSLGFEYQVKVRGQEQTVKVKLHFNLTLFLTLATTVYFRPFAFENWNFVLKNCDLKVKQTLACLNYLVPHRSGSVWHSEVISSKFRVALFFFSFFFRKSKSNFVFVFLFLLLFVFAWIGQFLTYHSKIWRS